ncbi:MAG: DUF1659 domain-containing protein [Paraclostridium sp.]
MTVSETKNPSALKIKFDCGLNNDGKTIVRSRTYNNVKPNATSQDCLVVARALIALQKHTELENNSIIPGNFPDNITSTMQYGINLKSLALALNTMGMVSIERTHNILSDLTN